MRTEKSLTEKFLRDLRTLLDRYRHNISSASLAVEMTAMAEGLELEAKILRSLAESRQTGEDA